MFNFIRKSAFCLLLVSLCACAACAAVANDSVYSKTVTQDGKNLVVIGNPYVELTFEPARGGRCSSFRFLDNGEQLVGKESTSGMFIDHWAKFIWPSGLMHLPYDYKIVGDGKTRVGVKLWITVPTKGGGAGNEDPKISLQIPTSPEFIGLVVAKTIWLNAANNAVDVEQEVTNPTSESRGVAIYVQHAFNMNGSRLYDNWYLPSTNGVAMHLQPDDLIGRITGVDWVRDPTAGWIAVRDRKTDRGLLIALDYNYLQKTYTCGQTAEWYLETVPVEVGKTFKTGYVVKPVRGFQDFVYGSKNVVADIRADEADGKVRVAHDIAAVNAELDNITVSMSVIGWKSKKILSEQTFPLKKLGYEKTSQEFDFVPDNLATGVVIQAVVKGSGFEEHYEYYYAGEKVEAQRKRNNFASQAGDLAAPLPGAKGDSYYQDQPRKIKHFDKPDFAKIARPAKNKFKVLVVFGLYTDMLKLDDALQTWKHAGASAPEFVWVNCPPNAVEGFPGSYGDLFSYNTIVLSDVNFKAVGDIGFEMLCDYVQQGGNLLVAGGPYAYGNGEFEGSKFLDMLPVTVTGRFDLKWAGTGKSWQLAPSASSNKVLQGVSFAQSPKVFWHHFVAAKTGAEVVLKAGEKPVLVLGRYGKGRVAALTLSPTGDPKGGETAWWDWEGWSPLVKNIFTWLNG